MSALQKAFAMRFGASAVDFDSYHTQKLHSSLIDPPISYNRSHCDQPENKKSPLTSKTENHPTMKIKTKLYSATVAVLFVSHMTLSMTAHAQDDSSTQQVDFERLDEGKSRWKNLPISYSWLEAEGASGSACLFIEREDKSTYETLGILKLSNPQPGSYILSADMKVEEFGDGKAKGSIYLDLYQEGQYVSIKPSGISSGPTGGAWVKVEGKVNIPEGVTNGWIGAIIPK